MNKEDCPEDSILRDDHLFSRKEAARYLGISPKTLAAWASTGRFKIAIVRIGRLIKHRRSVLDEFISERTDKPWPHS
ncbi:MAG: helix-turn-helix domain-containing protein [Sterolibacterium sp.]